MRGSLLVRHGSARLLDDQRKLRRADHDPGSGVADAMPELLGPIHGVDRDDDRIGAQDPIDCSDELWRVLHDQGHTVAASHARDLLKPSGQRFTSRQELRVREGSSEKQQRFLVRIAPRCDLDVGPKRGLRQHQALRLPRGPELQVRAIAGHWHRGISFR
jgi:hypothetical protein